MGEELLSEMARSSVERVAAARGREPEPALRRRARDQTAPPGLVRHASGFDLIAEVKRRAPSAGCLVGPEDEHEDACPSVVRRASAYARGGAAAVSVLTEPTRFGGALTHLSACAAALPVPALRKDFLVDPYQVFEARAAGAGGVLLIFRMLDDARLREMLDAARETGLFVLLEAFDAEDLVRAGSLPWGHPETPSLLLGLNARDLATFLVDRTRLTRLVARFPSGFPRVAESGMERREHVAEAAAAGYDLALVGAALMRSADPEATVAELLAAGRHARRVRRPEGGSIPCASA